MWTQETEMELVGDLETCITFLVKSILAFLTFAYMVKQSRIIILYFYQTLQVFSSKELCVLESLKERKCGTLLTMHFSV